MPGNSSCLIRPDSTTFLVDLEVYQLVLAIACIHSPIVWAKLNVVTSMTERPTVWRVAILMALSSLILFSFLGSARLWDRDEPRNARASQEMLARGDWIVPTFNNELRAHKPILLYWLQMSAYQLFGQSEFTARLPSAISGLIAVLAMPGWPVAWLVKRRL